MHVMLRETNWIVEIVTSGSRHETRGWGLQHGALNRTKGRGGFNVAIASCMIIGPISVSAKLTGMVTPQVLHVVGGVRIEPGVKATKVALMNSCIGRRVHFRPVGGLRGQLWPLTGGHANSGSGRRGSSCSCLSGGLASRTSVSATLTHVLVGRPQGGRWPLVPRTIWVLLHVFGQVGFLGVWFAAELTNVSFEVFGLLMLRNVLQKSCFVYKTFVTWVTFVWFISLVASGVGLEVTELTEGFGAPWMSAFVRLIPGVCPNMLLQMRQLRELALTNFTPRRRKKGYINGGCCMAVLKRGSEVGRSWRTLRLKSSGMQKKLLQKRPVIGPNLKQQGEISGRWAQCHFMITSQIKPLW